MGHVLDVIGGIALGIGVLLAVFGMNDSGQLWAGVGVFFAGLVILGIGAITKNTTPAAQFSEGKACPFCAEQIKAEALKCKHCGSQVAP